MSTALVISLKTPPSIGWQNWAKFDITRDFGAWLHGITRNKWRGHFRKEPKTSAWDEEALSSLEATIQELPENGSFDQLQDCLSKLPETLSAPVLVHYYRHLSTAETAETLNTNEAATRKRPQRASAALKACLSNKI